MGYRPQLVEPCLPRVLEILGSILTTAETGMVAHVYDPSSGSRGSSSSSSAMKGIQRQPEIPETPSPKKKGRKKCWGPKFSTEGKQGVRFMAKGQLSPSCPVLLKSPTPYMLPGTHRLTQSLRTSGGRDEWDGAT